MKAYVVDLERYYIYMESSVKKAWFVTRSVIMIHGKLLKGCLYYLKLVAAGGNGGSYLNANIKENNIWTISGSASGCELRLYGLKISGYDASVWLKLKAISI